jgi:hypothetical protein
MNPPTHPPGDKTTALIIFEYIMEHPGTNDLTSISPYLETEEDSYEFLIKHMIIKETNIVYKKVELRWEGEFGDIEQDTMDIRMSADVWPTLEGMWAYFLYKKGIAVPQIEDRIKAFG